MPDEVPPPDELTALMRRVDAQLGEAVRLREQAVTRSRDDRSFWPERRHTSVPHDPERRAGYR